MTRQWNFINFSRVATRQLSKDCGLAVSLRVDSELRGTGKEVRSAILRKNEQLLAAFGSVSS